MFVFLQISQYRGYTFPNAEKCRLIFLNQSVLYEAEILLHHIFPERSCSDGSSGSFPEVVTSYIKWEEDK